MLRRWPILIWLAVAWIALWGDLSVGTVLAGVIVAVLVTAVFPLPAAGAGLVLHPVGLLRFAVRFVLDLVVASIQVAWLAIRPRPLDPSSVIAVVLTSRSDLFITLTAEAITLIPGSLILQIDRERHTLYVHAIGVHTQEGAASVSRDVLAVEARLLRALSPRDPSGNPTGDAAGHLPPPTGSTP